MFEYFGTRSGFAQRRDLCFLGGYRHTPNVDAVLYFVREVLPLIRAREPDVRFIIAGAHPPDEVRALAGDGVVVTGMVRTCATCSIPAGFSSARCASVPGSRGRSLRRCPTESRWYRRRSASKERN